MTKPILPIRNQTAVYQIGEDTIYVEGAVSGLFALENISVGVTCAVRNRDETRAWLSKRNAKFVELLNQEDLR